jgi:phi13 family phage major tail protein
MDQKYGEFVGVDSLHYAPITANTDTAYTPSSPVYLAPAAEVAAAAKVSNTATYYDNAAAGSYVTEGTTDIKVVVSNLDSKTLATLLGKSYDATSGQVYDSGAANPPLVALGFRFNMGADGYRYYWYYVGRFGGGEEAATTKKDDVDVKTYELTFTALTTSKKFPVGGKTVPLKRVFADTADTAFTGEEDWFSAVQVPAA